MEGAMKQFKLKDRLQYWLDKKMARGTVSMIRVLVTATAVFVLLASIIMLIFKLGESEGFIANVWDVLITTIGEEWPHSGDGSLGYVIMTSLAACMGLMFTSILIGIITSGIEERLNEMRKGTSKVLERGHTVVLGFTPGEYSLIKEIVEGYSGRRGTVVVAEDSPREDMENLIYENVNVPSKVDVICRTIDITDQSELACCSPAWASSVVISPGDNDRVLKTALSVESALSNDPDTKTKIIATVQNSKYVIQQRRGEESNLIMLSTGDIVARLIAHCSTQPGLSGVFTDIFNYEGSEFYEEKVPGTIGKTFGEVVQIANGGSVVGISNKNGIRLNPPPGLRLRADDKIVYFGDNRGSLSLEENYDYERPVSKDIPEPVGVKNLIIIGFNETLTTILRELPERRHDVTVVTNKADAAQRAINRARSREEINVTVQDIDLSDSEILENAVKEMDYVVLLSDRSLEDDEADTEIMLMLFKLHDIRERLGLSFSITAEMKREKNRELVFLKDPTDFIIASNISSMIMAQIAGNFRLRYLFDELLSNRGSEIYLRTAESIGCSDERITIREVRHRAIEFGYLVMGYLLRERGEGDLHMDPDPESKVTLRPDDYLVVVGRK